MKMKNEMICLIQQHGCHDDFARGKVMDSV